MREKALGLSTLLIGLAVALAWFYKPQAPDPTPVVVTSEIPAPLHPPPPEISISQSDTPASPSPVLQNTPEPAQEVVPPAISSKDAPPSAEVSNSIHAPRKASDGPSDSQPPTSEIKAAQIPQPPPPAAREKSSESDPQLQVVHSGPSSSKQVALTFDDGPHPAYTAKILDILREHKVKATFFVLGNRVKQYPWILRQIVAEGHEIGNHTYDHRWLTAMDNSLISREIADTQAAIRNATGYETSLFRPPYGAFRNDTRTVFKEHHLNIVLWNVDTKDWSSHNQDRILANVTNQTRNGSIILCHDIHKATLDALPSVLKALESRGYEFTTVNQLCGLPSLKLASDRPSTATAQAR